MAWLAVFLLIFIYALVYKYNRDENIKASKEQDMIAEANAKEIELDCRRRMKAVVQRVKEEELPTIDEAYNYVMGLSNAEDNAWKNSIKSSSKGNQGITDASIKALSYAAVEKNGLNLQFVPNELRTLELCLMAIQQDVRAFEFVPPKIKTPEFCMILFQQSGYADWSALEFVPEELKTSKLCNRAIQQSGCALEFVPEELKTPELCLMAIEASCYPYNEYAFVPLEFFKSSEFCRSIVQMVNWEPKAGVGVWTTELCVEAVRKDAWASLPFIPDSLKTLKVGLTAVKEQPWAIVLLPSDLRTQVYDAAIAAAREKGYEGNDNEIIEEIYERGHRASEYS